MIVHVTEWCGNDMSTFFFDTGKCDLSVPFECMYAQALEDACSRNTDWVDLSNDPRVVPRFSGYHDVSRKWKRLHARPPCCCDAAVTVIVDHAW